MLKRKGLAASLVICLALISACSSKTDNTNSSSTSPASASTAPVKADAKPALKSLQINQSQDYNTYPVAKLLEEKTGYKVQYEMLPSDKPSDKLNLIMASAEAYDAVTTIGGSDFQALYADYAKKGALTDLTLLIDQYGPNIKAMISPASLEAMKVDGKIYAIPTKALEFVGFSLMIRQDWLDKLNLKMPTTLDELVNVLQQFKDKDPGGNGDKNIPMTIDGDVPFIEDIVGAFGIPNNWNEVDGLLTPRALDPAYKEYAAFVTDLFQKGLLDKEFAVNKKATALEKISSGRAGVIPIHWADVPTVADSLKKNFPAGKLTFVGALKGKDGKSGFSATSGVDRITFIPKASKHPEDTIKWINAKLDKDTFKLMTIGEEGKHYTFTDGSYTPILPIFTEERNFANNFMMGVDEKDYPTYWQARVRKDMRLFDAFDTINSKQPAEVKFLDPLGSAPYLPLFTKNNLSLNNMLKDYTIKLIFGGEQLANLAQFQNKFKAAGGEDTSKEVNVWYAANKK